MSEWEYRWWAKPSPLKPYLYLIVWFGYGLPILLFSTYVKELPQRVLYFPFTLMGDGWDRIDPKAKEFFKEGK